MASFLTLPRLSAVLEETPPASPVELDVSDLKAVDHTTAELIRDWYNRRKTLGAPVAITGGAGRLPALNLG